jgi:hypothetical protein
MGVWGKMDDIKVTDRSLIWNSDLMETLELTNLMANAITTGLGRGAQGKPRRPCPRGLQVDGPFGGRDDENWRKHTLAWVDEKGKVKLDYRPVHTDLIADGIDLEKDRAQGARVLRAETMVELTLPKNSQPKGARSGRSRKARRTRANSRSIAGTR